MAFGSKALRKAVKTLPPIKNLVAQRDKLAEDLANTRKRVTELEQGSGSACWPLIDEQNPYGAIQFVPPGHYYSPVPSAADIERSDAERATAPLPSTVPGIDLNVAVQLETIRKLTEFYAENAFPEKQVKGRRYYYDNDLFGYGDATVLHCMLRLLRPRHIVEVGSGFSSALILDTRDDFLSPDTQCTFIEPDPVRLDELLSDADRQTVDILVAPVQDAPLSLFKALGPNDVLFIDSSHVSKLASDVNLLVFSILPSLKTGVYVHIHDIFYPFEYPAEWLHSGRFWTEDYLIRAFLEFNDEFEVVLFNSYLGMLHGDEVSSALPIWRRNPGGSLWLRRRSSSRS